MCRYDNLVKYLDQINHCYLFTQCTLLECTRKKFLFTNKILLPFMNVLIILKMLAKSYLGWSLARCYLAGTKLVCDFEKSGITIFK